MAMAVWGSVAMFQQFTDNPYIITALVIALWMGIILISNTGTKNDELNWD